jgi:hypothetical protein
MSQFLRADTAVKVTIGPVVAVGDGFTPVASLDLSTADEAEIIKHNTSSTTSISANSMTAISNADGYYAVDLTAGNLDTEGQLTLLVNDDSLCLPVKATFMVVPANVFDSLFGAAAPSLTNSGEVSREVGLVISGHGLDHLLLQSVAGTDVTDNSIFAKLVSKEATADWDDYVNTTDSLQAIRDQGDAAWISAVGLTSGDINREMGLVVSGHGLDHLLLQSVTGTDVTDDSIIAMLVSKSATADWDSYDNTSDSLEAIRDRGDAEWIGGGGLTSGDINREIGLVVSGHGLDHLLLQSVAGADITDNSIFAKLVSASATADWDSYDNTDDSLEAIRNRGDAAWIGGGGLTSGDINREIGLVVSGHGLDHLLLQSVTGTDVTDDSIIAMLVSASATADWDSYVNTTDSLQAIRDVEPHGTVMRGTDGANTTVPDAAGVLPTAVEIRTEMDSNSTELSKIGTIPALDGAGQTIGAAIAKLADDNGGTNFDATTDSLEAIRNRGDAAWIGGGGLTAGDVNAQVGLVISGHGLDHLLQISVAGTDIADDSIFAKLVSKEATADWDDYVNTTDSLQAIRDQGDSAWITAIGFSTLTFGEVNREMGLVVSGHGLDNFVFTTANKVDARVDYVGATSVSGPNDLKANVTNLDVAVSSLADSGEVNREIGLVISGHGLDHLIASSVTGTDVTDNSIFARLVSKEATADWDDYVNTTDSLQAIRDQGDSAWITAAGFSTHSAADVNREIGLVVSGHGLDNFVFTTSNKVDARIDYVGANPVTTPNDFKANVTNLDVAVSSLASPAEVSAEVGLIISGHGLDHLLLQSVAGSDITDNSIFAKLVSKSATADWDSFNNTTDSLEAIRDRGDAEWIGGGGLTTGDINREVGLVVSGHGLDHLLLQAVVGTDITDNSIFAKLVSKEATADWDDYVNTTDSLQAIRDRGDAAWIGGGGLTTDDISREVGLVISGHGLDHLLLQAVIGTDITDNSLFAKLVSKSATADWDDFDNTSDSLEAIRDQGDSAWITAVGFSTHSTGDISREIGLVVSGHNLDSFVFTTSNKVDARVDYVGANPVTTPNDFKANVANLDVAVSSLADSGEVNREIGLVISGHGLDHLLSTSVTGTDVTDDSIIAMLVSASATADWDSFDNTDDSLEAIRNRGDAAWIGGGGLTSGDINREVGLVVSGHGLDHLLLQPIVGTDVTDDSLFAKLVSKEATADWDDFINTTDSLQAIRDQGDSAWITAVGFSTLSFGEVNREIGLVISGHGLDHLLASSVTGTDITDDSIFAMLVSASATADWDDYVNTTDSLQALRDNLATPADVNTQVLDVVNTDTFAEPAQGTPPATTTLVTKINYLYKFLRNRLTVTSGTISVYNDDAVTVDHKSTHSDDGTTYDRGEFITGP